MTFAYRHTAANLEFKWFYRPIIYSAGLAFDFYDSERLMFDQLNARSPERVFYTLDSETKQKKKAELTFVELTGAGIKVNRKEKQLEKS